MFKRTPRWLWPALLAGLILASPTAFVRGYGANRSAHKGKKVKNPQHRADLQYQRRRIKQSGRMVRTEARQTGRHVSPPKAQRHQVTHVPRHNKRENPNLSRARKENRSRRSARH